jgi:hypothetical protein
MARRFRAASPGLAWVLGGAVIALATAAAVLTALAGRPGQFRAADAGACPHLRVDPGRGSAVTR